jgi:hypothetical protein
MRAVLLAVVLLGMGNTSLAEAPSLPAGLEPRLRRVEGAFRTGNASSLRSSLAGDKVRVDLRELTSGAESYGSGQLEVIFARIYEDHRTREFSFRDEDVTVSVPGTAFARARWVRRPRAGGPEVTDTLTFTFREDDGDWRIHEIRSSR